MSMEDSCLEEGIILVRHLMVILYLLVTMQVEYVCQDGTVKFKDGGSVQPDIILHCTGLVQLEFDFPQFLKYLLYLI